MNSFGRIFKLTDYGDTHGEAMGGIIEGCPAGVFIDIEFIQNELTRRAPSFDSFSTQRKETDLVHFTSGITNHCTTGAPIAFFIPNVDVQTNTETINVIKPSHASYTYHKKYGCENNIGCGRASARQTVCRVVAGAIAKLILKPYLIHIETSVKTRGHSKKEEDTIGAIVAGSIKNLPAGLGEPVYDKFHARLGYAMLSINAAKGFEIGKGYAAAEMCGSQYNDIQNPDFSFQTNHDGGVQAGITNGEEVYFTVAFKPIPTLQIEQKTITFNGEFVHYTGNKRNDKCVVPRVLPVVEAMAALVTVDFLLLNKAYKR
ncbi:MAG: chorismate synthase [Bacteroidales bacterium]